MDPPGPRHRNPKNRAPARHPPPNRRLKHPFPVPRLRKTFGVSQRALPPPPIQAKVRDRRPNLQRSLLQDNGIQRFQAAHEHAERDRSYRSRHAEAAIDQAPHLPRLQPPTPCPSLPKGLPRLGACLGARRPCPSPKKVTRKRQNTKTYPQLQPPNPGNNIPPISGVCPFGEE